LEGKIHDGETVVVDFDSQSGRLTFTPQEAGVELAV
jgi:hypothetical protein